jgi:hypothetical protein
MSRRGRISFLAAAVGLIGLPSSALSDPPKVSNTTARGQTPGLPTDHCKTALQQALRSCSREYPQGTQALRNCVARAERVAATCESISNVK